MLGAWLRRKDYNHSTFCDLIIAGLVGLRAAFGSLLTISPLADSTIGWFALDNVAYHNRNNRLRHPLFIARSSFMSGTRG